MLPRLDPVGRKLRFFVPGEPVAWARAGRGNGATFTPARQRHFGAIVKEYGHTAMAGAAPVDGPIDLHVTVIYPWGKSATKRRRAALDGAWKATKPDIDNACLKLVCDSLNQVIWRDDCQVARSAIAKLFGERPGVLVLVASLDGIDATPLLQEAFE